MDQNPNILLDLLGIPCTSLTYVDFFDSLGRANVVLDDHLPKPPPKTVRHASRNSGWDVDVFTAAEYDCLKRDAIAAFSTISKIDGAIAQKLVAVGFMTLEDLSVIDPEVLARLSGFDSTILDEVAFEVDRRCLERDLPPSSSN